MGEINLKVKLFSYTDCPEEKVATAAKLCYSRADIAELKKGIDEQDQSSFLRKLIKMGHYSPVEHVSFTFGIEGVSRSLLAQITRHRLASFSVKSQRYVEESASQQDIFNYIVPLRIKNLGEEYINEYKEQMKQIQSWYNYWMEMLASDESAKEDARFVLPNAAETKFIVTMNARELHHFFNLRCCNRAQWEIRALATEMLRLVKKAAPVLFEDAGPRCLQGPCPEGDSSCGQWQQVREKFKNLT
ncbi:MAG: FAD-dependent thymidylate synthase [Clostridiales bacterium]|nr:FAD-dependent thymidylate synthase [Clostridiales bacterium]MCF8023643.1 FAD-dependent thymidylate synthase [Clostridiales bacterium]